MTLPLKAARQILADLGYWVTPYQDRHGRHYFVERGPLAIKYDLPKPERSLAHVLDGFSCSDLKAFCISAVSKAGCTSLPTKGPGRTWG